MFIISFKLSFVRTRETFIFRSFINIFLEFPSLPCSCGRIKQIDFPLSPVYAFFLFFFLFFFFFPTGLLNAPLSFLLAVMPLSLPVRRVGPPPPPSFPSFPPLNPSLCECSRSFFSPLCRRLSLSLPSVPFSFALQHVQGRERERKCLCVVVLGRPRKDFCPSNV